jgi:hypothetical protein
MKKLLLAVLVLGIGFGSCTKDEVETPVAEVPVAEVPVIKVDSVFSKTNSFKLKIVDEFYRNANNYDLGSSQPIFGRWYPYYAGHSIGGISYDPKTKTLKLDAKKGIKSTFLNCEVVGDRIMTSEISDGAYVYTVQYFDFSKRTGEVLRHTETERTVSEMRLIIGTDSYVREYVNGEIKLCMVP